MPCVNADGSLTAIARQVLEALQTPANIFEMHERSGVPIYRIRSSVRELSDLGMMSEQAGVYSISEKGRAMLSRP